MLLYTVSEQRGAMRRCLAYIDYCCIGPPCWPACHLVALQSGWERETSWGRIRHVKEQKPELMLAERAVWPCTSWFCRRDKSLLSSWPETEGEMTEDSERERPKNRGSSWTGTFAQDDRAPPHSNDGPPPTAFKERRQEWRRCTTRPPPHRDGKH